MKDKKYIKLGKLVEKWVGTKLSQKTLVEQSGIYETAILGLCGVKIEKKSTDKKEGGR